MDDNMDFEGHWEIVLHEKIVKLVGKIVNKLVVSDVSNVFDEIHQ